MLHSFPFVVVSYMILDFMETDLHKIIYSKNELTDEHIQYFVYQILKGQQKKTLPYHIVRFIIIHRAPFSSFSRTKRIH